MPKNLVLIMQTKLLVRPIFLHFGKYEDLPMIVSPTKSFAQQEGINEWQHRKVHDLSATVNERK